MSITVELDDDLRARLDAHLEEGQTYEDFIEELIAIYESNRFLREGYSE